MQDGWCGYMGSDIVCYSRLIQLDLRYHLMFVEIICTCTLSLYIHSVQFLYKCSFYSYSGFIDLRLYKIQFLQFISQTEDGQCKMPKLVVVLYVVNSIHVSTTIQLFQTNTYTPIQFNYKQNGDDEPYEYMDILKF